MKIIITGAGGFLGWELARAAHDAGWQVTGIGRTAQPPAAGVVVEWVQADLGSRDWLARDWADHAGATIFHLAADTQIYSEPAQALSNPVAWAEAAAAVARQTGGGVVFCSSAAVYSGPDTESELGRLTELSPTQPRSAYGQGKLAAERALLAAGVDVLVMRLFGVVGRRLLACPDRGNLVQAIVRAVQERGEVVIGVDDLGREAVRDYVAAEDVVRFALQALPALRRGRSGARPIQAVVNFCSGRAVRMTEVIDAAQRAGWSGFTCRREHRPAVVNRVMVGDPATVRRLVGWVPSPAMDSFWSTLWSESGRPPGARSDNGLA